MVDWRFLLNMLAGFGFHNVLISWIKEMVTTPTYSVAVNGESKGFFSGQRGIRQGDPLSPYLFTLIMEGFAMIFRQCIHEATDFGYHPGCREQDLTHLCFADDLFVFTAGDVQSVEILKKALYLFQHKAGLAPNIAKSDVFFGNVPNDTREAILTCLPFRMGSFPIRYLGVPLSPISLKVADYGVIVAKAMLRVQNWKSKFLSFGGRKQLIISVLQSLQLYWMAIYMFPSAVLHELESTLRSFLWSQGDVVSGRCRLAWDKVCRPKESGGLGFKRLSIWNRALVSKNLWDILSSRPTMWVEWVKRMCLRNSNFWLAKAHRSWSWVFRKMMDVRPQIRPFVHVAIGDGACTHAWEDSWAGCGELAPRLTYRLIHATGFTVNTSVREFLISVDEWPTEWVTRNPVLSTIPLPTLRDNQADVVKWRSVDSALVDFSVKDAYVSLDGRHDVIPWTSRVWFSGHIPKHAFCLWIACHKRHPTHDRMLNWKHDPPDWKCSLCGVCMDSHDHLFFDCVYSLEVWKSVTNEVGWINAPSSWSVMMNVLADDTGAPRKLVHKLALAASVYMIWRERNARIFTDDRKTAKVLAKNILSVVRMRMAWKKMMKMKTISHEP